MSADYEYEFDPNAVNNTAASVYRLVLEGGKRVLDIGSGPAIVSSHLARHDGRHVTCLDQSARSLRVAEERGVQRTFQVDLDAADWWRPVEGEQFDVVILADVLEHLHNPGALLRTVREEQILAPDGFVVVSIPNAAHEGVIASLVTGRFNYTETGLLDRTHIRFFTRRTFEELSEEVGFMLSSVHRTFRSLEQTELAALAPDVPPLLRRELNDGAADHQTYQYVMRLVPMSSSGQLRRLRDELAALREERMAAAEKVRREHRAELAQAAAAKTDNEAAVQRLQDEIALKQAKLMELEGRLLRLSGERDAAIAQRVALETAGSSLRAELAEQKATVAKQQREIEHELKPLLHETEEELRKTRHQLREAGEDLRATEARARKLLAERDEQVERARAAERKVRDIYASETWKLGRGLTWIPRQLHRLGRGNTSPPTGTERGIGQPARSVATGGLAVRHELEEDMVRRREYEAHASRTGFRGQGRRIAFGVSTVDLELGRGDLYTAIGLGRELESFGYDVLYVPPERWYDLPGGTEIFVSMLAEKSAMVDPLHIPGDCMRLAWIRNLTDRWVNSDHLSVYDGILASSQVSLSKVRKAYAGPSGILPIAVDRSLFVGSETSSRHGVISTVNGWGRERQLHETLASGPIDFPLALYGQERGLMEQLSPYSLGPVSFFALPSLYRQAKVVLDDQQDVNRPYGNVNSRVYEALAAGALPISNSDVGLHRMGLESLPCYGSAEELRRLINHYLDDEAARFKLVDSLRERVLERHTYWDRARELDAFIRQSALTAWQERNRRPATAFYPDYRHTNPFQEMLLKKRRAQGDVVFPASDEPSDLMHHPALEDRPLVYNLHWTAPLLGGAKSEEEAEQRCERFLRGLDRFIGAGGRVIWTLHNAMPHECAYPRTERRLRQGLADRSHAIHVLSEETAEVVAPYFSLPADRVRHIPHGSYVGVYPNVVDQAVARSELQLSDEATVLLFLGGIRPYKGLERLLDAFDMASQHDASLYLAVAGKPGRFPEVSELRERCERHPRIHTHFEHVEDHELQLYLNAADVVVLPHKKILNSGGLHLAWSFGRPVIASRLGSLSSLVTPDVGLTFDPETEDLAQVLARASELKERRYTRATFQRAQAFTYLDMADGFSDLVDEVL